LTQAFLSGTFFRSRKMDDKETPTTRPTVETDARFPSGEWVGFWLQKSVKGRQRMELQLAFSEGLVNGEGKDCVGQFTMRGHYDLQSGRVTIHKRYVRQHDVFYSGWAEEGKGIWGVWHLAKFDKGGFHIWPKGMADPTGSHLREEAEVPVEAEGERQLQPVGPGERERGCLKSGNLLAPVSHSDAVPLIRIPQPHQIDQANPRLRPDVGGSCEVNQRRDRPNRKSGGSGGFLGGSGERQRAVR
jgi:hypothetical protein